MLFAGTPGAKFTSASPAFNPVVIIIQALFEVSLIEVLIVAHIAFIHGELNNAVGIVNGIRPNGGDL